jgi:hypothetical protein
MPRGLLARSTTIVLAKAGVASAAMALVLAVLRGQGFPLLALVPLGGATYGLVGILLRLVPPEDFRLIMTALGRRRIADFQTTDEGQPKLAIQSAIHNPQSAIGREAVILDLLPADELPSYHWPSMSERSELSSIVHRPRSDNTQSAMAEETQA